MATDRIPLAFGKSTGGAAIEIQELPIGDQISPIWVAGLTGSNMLINGDMRINQRVFGGGSLAAASFGYDRWFADTGGANVSVNAAGVITHTSGTICQAIEAPRGAFGVSVTVSVGDLSGGSLTVSVGGVSGTISAGAGRRYVNLTTPSSTGTGNLLVKITGSNVTYREVAVVRGADFPVYEQLGRPASILNAQRFWQKSYQQGVAPGTTNQDSGAEIILLNGLPAGPSYLFGVNVKFSPPMRTTAAVTIFSKTTGANGKLRDDNAGTDVNASMAGVSDAKVFVFGTIANTATSGINLQFQWVADAEITS
ncbi:hypothetical protein [Xanthomonas sp. SHU 199]|uniref:hypothetical protein n=1 Tax=Xanthomonas sp. SHU 199 TaxID=1591174 RepID=UPI0012FF0FE3|nr:hypothetical protein [Xanthomonas sp. SHU 199]